MSGSLSGSEEPPASKVHVIAVHAEVNEATGAPLTGGTPVSTPGLTTTENSWVLPPARLVVATRPAALPVGTAAPESARSELTLPPRVPAAVVRLVLSAGAVQVESSEDLSLQELTSQDPVWATVTSGVVCVVVEVVPAMLADAVTAEVPAELRYAVTLIADFTSTLEATVTLAFASAAVAFFVHARPRVVVPSLLSRRVQPEGLPRVALSEAVVRKTRRVSPACTVPGTCTVWLVRFPALLAAATNDSVGSAASARGAGLRPKAGSTATRVAARSTQTRFRARTAKVRDMTGWSPRAHNRCPHRSSGSYLPRYVPIRP